ncbi:unnamed protein product [Rotaria sp. Silwood2]|nr:unnamed protein product [Rotaria sp. Silwood2]CAF4163079.1 unnamed protein product [Rotaria sp. Silwood2]
MKLTTKLFWFLSFFLSGYVAHCSQPYFPLQITFKLNGDQTLVAVDEINQRAVRLYNYNSLRQENAFVMKHFPNPIPDSPQSRYYVQLSVSYPSNYCMYGTYWQYGGNVFNEFPSHWSINNSYFMVGNYIKFNSELIHSTNHTETEDYWYSNGKCQVTDGPYYPCEEIYFKKGTDIPL